MKAHIGKAIGREKAVLHRAESTEKSVFTHGEAKGHSSLANFGGTLHQGKARIKKI